MPLCFDSCNDRTIACKSRSNSAKRIFGDQRKRMNANKIADTYVGANEEISLSEGRDGERETFISATIRG